MTTLKNLTIEQRADIIRLYNEGKKIREISPIYGTHDDTIRNTIAYMRRHGAVVPFRIARKVKVPKQELLVLPLEFAKKTQNSYSHADKRKAYQTYRTSGAGEVAKMFGVTKNTAYYMISEGRKLSGVKGRTRKSFVPGGNPMVVEARKEKTGVQSDNLGFFILGGAIALLVQAII